MPVQSPASLALPAPQHHALHVQPQGFSIVKLLASAMMAMLKIAQLSVAAKR